MGGPIVNLTPERKGAKYKLPHEYHDAPRITLGNASVTGVNMENATPRPNMGNLAKYIQIHIGQTRQRVGIIRGEF